MKTIVITGPSGSGKSYLSKKLSEIFYNSIVVKTDSYYRDNILIKFLSIFLYDIYDKPFSLKKKEIKQILTSIQNKDRLISFHNYDFKKKNSSISKKRINYKTYNQFLILEGIFAHRLDLDYQETINILCEEKKEVCFNRRLKRDQIERGRNNKEVKKKFNKSWTLFYQNIEKYINSNKVIRLNTDKKISYDKLVLDLKK
tara:strand:- start:545 stop:1144 length:600 start_codon:yes stop_codon:yes gene_type:complete